MSCGGWAKGPIETPSCANAELSDKRIRATDDVLGFEVGRVFVRAVFSQDVLAASKTMVGKIRQSFIDGLEKVHWMDATTKAAASAKASEMVDKFG